jgi:hypothetical protein
MLVLPLLLICVKKRTCCAARGDRLNPKSTQICVELQRYSRRENMVKKNLIFPTVLGLALLAGSSLAQDPVVNIDRARHPNLAEAQEHLVAANAAIARAQADNRYDMKGHAEKARQHLAEADRELKAAAAAANEGMKR